MHSLSCRPQSWRVSSRQGGGSHPAPPRRAGPLQTHPNVRTRRYISRFTRSHDAPANKDAVLHSGEHFVEDGQTDRRVTGLEDTIVQGSDPQSKIMEIVQEQGSPRTDFADGLVSSYELQAEEHQISEAKMEEQTAPHDIGKKYMREIWAFALPALGMVLSDPLMSLVDTASIGQISSLHVGALGPCSSLFMLIFVVTSFLSVAVTNIVASSATNGAMMPAVKELRRERAKKAVSHGLFLATTIGGVAVTALLLWTAPILELFGASGELLAPAMAYTKIRALAIPAMIAIIVCQGASLGQQDASTPFKAALSAGIVNVIGDAILVPHISIVGAAVATVAAQWGAALGFVWHMMRRDPAGDKVPLRWMGLPTAADLQPFWDIATAVVSRNILIMTAYTLMTKTASSMGVIPLATHQIALTVFWLISVAVEPINMAAQTLIARDISLPHLLRPLAFSLLRVGATMGLILALVCSGTLEWLPFVFTGDSAVQAGLRGLVTQAAIALPICGVMMVMDGINVGSSDMSHVPRLNLVALLGTAAYLRWVAASGAAVGVMWWSMPLFFLLRGGQNAIHLYMGRRHNVFAPVPQPVTAPAAQPVYA